MWFAILVIALNAYLLGNLNGSVCISALVAKDDVRSHGSGNAGLTNYVRNYGAKSALLVIAVDMGKAILACLVGKLILTPYEMSTSGLALGGLCLILGHDFPALLGFRGGKGILSGVTVALLMDWRLGLTVFAIFLVAYLLTGYVSLGSVLSAGSFGFLYALFHWGDVFPVVAGFIMSAVIVWMHRQNIFRLTCPGHPSAQERSSGDHVDLRKGPGGTDEHHPYQPPAARSGAS